MEQILEQPERKIRIRIRKAVVGEGGRTWFPGETHTAAEWLAHNLVERRRAEYVDPKDARRRGRP